MYNLHSHLPFSYLTLCVWVVGVLLVAYVGLIALVMSSAVLTVEFSQSVKNDEAAVAVLESEYLSAVARITGANYGSEGYAKPLSQSFVRAENVTALR